MISGDRGFLYLFLNRGRVILILIPLTIIIRLNGLFFTTMFGWAFNDTNGIKQSARNKIKFFIIYVSSFP